MITEKALVLEKRYGKQCTVCMLIDSDQKDMKWHLYKVDLVQDCDQWVCDSCVEGVKDIRRKCHLKVDNPNHDSFSEFVPWFAKDVPGLVDAFKRRV